MMEHDSKLEYKLKIADVMDMLNISDATARRLVKHGKLKGIKIAKDYRFSEKSLQDFIESASTAKTQ